MKRPAELNDRPSGPAPADAIEHVPWPAWRKVFAYALLTGLALVSIWAVDRKVDHLPALTLPNRQSR